MKYTLTSFVFATLLVSSAGFAQHLDSKINPADFTLKFKAGEIHRVSMTEVLRLMMHFSQVEEDAAKPSVRTSKYSFTETVDSVYPDGAALISATLDSFQTIIIIGEGKDAEEFFNFNSSNEHDLQHNFHDIKTLPRAQFLGQTLKFVMYSDGTVHDIRNLRSFHDNAVGKGYDYDMVHAMLSLADSLRIGQLLELGSGGLSSLRSTKPSPTTATEIPIQRVLTPIDSKANTLDFRTTYSNPPEKIDYLEGIATPLGIKTFNGGGRGEITMKDHFLSHAAYRDTANVLLQVDIEEVPEEITRIVTMNVSPVRVLRGGTVSLEEKVVHRGILKDPTKDEDKDAVVIDPASGKSENPAQVNH